MTLKDRAISAYEAQREAERAEAEQSAQRAKEAHVEHLRLLCRTVLQLALNPAVYWLPHSDYCWPVAEIDGLLFSCPPDRDSLEILTCVSASDVFQRGTQVESVYGLGKILCDPYHKPCTIKDGLIVKA